MNNYLLYLNLWGTTAKLAEENELSPASDVEPCQHHFIETLRALANEPRITVAQMADVAYVGSADLEVLIGFAAAAFGAMLEQEGEFRFWPLRGAIARGESPRLSAQAEATENFRALPVYGLGAVEVARLEKSAQKGARLFLSPELEEEAAQVVGSSVRDRSTRILAHAELNWLHLMPDVEARVRIAPRLREKAYDFIEVGTNYSQQMAGSLLDVIKWSESSSPPV